MKYSYCKIFTTLEESALISMLADLFKGSFERRSMFLSGLVVEVRRNPDVLPEVVSDTDFIRWPLLVELEADDEFGERVMVETVKSVLASLWQRGHGAVAACDFEDELPWGGGVEKLRY